MPKKPSKTAKPPAPAAVKPPALEDCRSFRNLMERLDRMKVTNDRAEWERLQTQCYFHHGKVRDFCKKHGLYATLPVIPRPVDRWGPAPGLTLKPSPQPDVFVYDPAKDPGRGARSVGTKNHPSKGATLSPELRANRAKKKRVKLRHGSIDWPQARHLYVRGEPGEGPESPRKWYSLREVAERLGCHEGTVCARSAEEDWPAQRLAFQRQLQDAENARLIQMLADQKAKAAVQFFGTAVKGARAIDRKLNQDEVSASDLSRLGAGLKSFQGVAQVATGQPADGPQNVMILDWTALRRTEDTQEVRAKVLDSLGCEDWDG